MATYYHSNTRRIEKVPEPPQAATAPPAAKKLSLFRRALDKLRKLLSKSRRST